MKKVYRYIKFDEIAPDGYRRFLCHNKKTLETLGYVKWHEAWNKYIYSSALRIVYSADCLTDIAAFLEQLNALQDDEEK